MGIQAKEVITNTGRERRHWLVCMYVCLSLGEVAKHGSFIELTCPGYILNPCIPLEQGGREALS